jgi:hypothetical protein
MGVIEPVDIIRPCRRGEDTIQCARSLRTA